MINDKIKYECTEKLIHAFITSRLDYFNSLFYGVPDHHMRKLQRVMNASAKFILNTVILRRSLNNFTGCLSAYVSKVKSFWSPLKYSRAQLLNISLIQFLFYRHPVMNNGEISRGFFWAPQSVSENLSWGIDILHGGSATALEQYSRKD